MDMSTEYRVVEFDKNPTPNLPLLRKTLEHIKAHPEEWNQDRWYTQKPDGETSVEGNVCQTAACVAGHALIFSGHKLSLVMLEDDDDLETASVLVDGELGVSVGDVPWALDAPHFVAAQELGLTYTESTDLFNWANNKERVQRIANEIAARAGEPLGVDLLED